MIREEEGEEGIMARIYMRNDTSLFKPEDSLPENIERRSSRVALLRCPYTGRSAGEFSLVLSTKVRAGRL